MGLAQAGDKRNISGYVGKSAAREVGLRAGDCGALFVDRLVGRRWRRLNGAKLMRKAHILQKALTLLKPALFISGLAALLERFFLKEFKIGEAWIILQKW